MTIIKEQLLTFAEWLQELTKPKRTYYMVISDHHMRCTESEFKRAERVYVGRKEQSYPFIVLCPESNCKILIQTNGGKRGAPLTATWQKNKKFKNQ